MSPSNNFELIKSKVFFFIIIIIILLTLFASIFGIVNRDIHYINDDFIQTFVPNDIVNLIVGLPFILISFWLILRNKTIGLICICGALFYLLYIYFPYILSLPINVLLVFYITIFVISLYTLIVLLTKIDSKDIKEQIRTTVPNKLFGGILIGLSLVLIARQVLLIIIALINHTVVEKQILALWIDDLLIGSPAMLIGGYYLWKDKSIGYILSGSLYLVFGLLSFSLIPYMIIQAKMNNNPIEIIDLLVLLLLTIVCFLPFLFYLKGSVINYAKEKIYQ